MASRRVERDDDALNARMFRSSAPHDNRLVRPIESLPRALRAAGLREMSERPLLDGVA